MRPVVYISGPITSGGGIPQVENQYRFSVVENMLLKRGYAPVNPASDALAIGMGGITYDVLMDKDEALISKCDAMYMLGGWEISPGAAMEYGFAQHHGVPVVENLDALDQIFKEDWVDALNEGPDE